ncbi:MAG: hypothetical protein ACXITV_06125 [Luteibaculaceae bacterium]
MIQIAPPKQIIKFFLSSTLLFLCFFTASAQERGAHVFGTIKDLKSGKRIEGATATLFSNGKELQKSSTTSNGKYGLKFDLDADYEIVFAKKGYFAKSINIDLREIPEEEKDQGVFQLNIEIELFEEIENIDASILKEPIGKSRFDHATGTITWDMDYTSKQQRKIQALMREYEAKLAVELARNKKFNELLSKGELAKSKQDFDGALAFYKEAEELKPSKKEELAPIIADIIAQRKMLAEAAARDAEFAKLFADAQNAFSDNDLVKAENKIVGALKIKPDDVSAKSLSSKINTQKEKTAQFEKLRSSGNLELTKKNYSAAIKDFESALLIFNDNQEVKTKLAEAKKLFEAEQRTAKLEENYASAIKEADNLFSKQVFEQAIAKYEEALGLKSNEKYPADRIKLAQAEIAKRDKEVLQENFNKLLASGDSDLTKNKFDEAIDSYTKAKNLIPSETIPDKRIEAAKAAKQAFLAKQDVEATYAGLIKEGDDLFTKKQYENALEKFKDAGSVKPNETYPKQKKIEIETILKDINEQFRKALANGNSQYNNEKYSDAITEYKRALQIKPSDSEALTLLKKAEDGLERQKAMANLDENYTKYISKGNSAFGVDNLDVAFENFTKASELKPTEQLPKDKLKEIEERRAALAKKDAEIKSLGVDTEFNDLVIAGNQSMQQGDFSSAINHYKNALKIKADDQNVQVKLTKAEQALANGELANIQKQYQQKIAEADKKFSAKQYEQAKLIYQEAIGINSEEVYPKNRINQIDKLLAARSDEKPLAQKNTLEPPKKPTQRAASSNKSSELDAEQFMEENFVALKNQNKLRVEQEKIDFIESFSVFETASNENKLQEEATLYIQRNQNANFNEAGLAINQQNKGAVEAQKAEELNRIEKETQKQQTLVYQNNQSNINLKTGADFSNDQVRRVNKTALADQKAGLITATEFYTNNGDKRNLDLITDVEKYKIVTYQGISNDAAVKAQKDGYELFNETLQRKAVEGQKSKNQDKEIDLFFEKSADNLMAVNLIKTANQSNQEAFQKKAAPYQDRGNAEMQLTKSGQDIYASKVTTFIENNKTGVALQKNAQQINTELFEDARNAEINKRKESIKQETQSLNSFEPRRNVALAEEFPQGITEQSYNEGNKIIIRRVVVEGKVADDYKKVIAQWGTFYFKNDNPITETMWRRETIAKE